jgi:hypothetical protein
LDFFTAINALVPVASLMNTGTARVVSIIRMIVISDSIPGRVEERPVSTVISIEMDWFLVAEEHRELKYAYGSGLGACAR